MGYIIAFGCACEYFEVCNKRCFFCVRGESAGKQGDRQGRDEAQNNDYYYHFDESEAFVVRFGIVFFHHVLFKIRIQLKYTKWGTHLQILGENIYFGVYF